MTRLIENEIATLIDQSNCIAELARNDQWDQIGHLTEKRQLALEKFFKLPIPKKSIQLIEKMIRKIMTIDHELIDYIEKEKTNTFKQFAHIQSNSKANKTYQNVATLNLP